MKRQMKDFVHPFLWTPIFAIALLEVNASAQTNCAPPPSGLVSWWRGETNTVDSRDGNHGTVVGNATYGAGRVGQAFVFDGNGDAIDLGNPTNLHLQTLTIEAWVKRAHPTLASFNSELSGDIVAYAWGGYALGLWDDGRILFGKVGFSAVSSTFTITDTNSFHHVAVTKAGTNVVLYLDGVAQAVGPYDPGFVFNGPAAIGARGLDYGGSFLGSIDEASIYNRALTSTEIQAIYNAAGSGKCVGTPPSIVTQPQSQTVNAGTNVTFSVTAVGTQPLNYQWRFNGSNIVGATSTSMTLSNVQSGHGGNYSVRVTNVFGAVISSNALLTVVSPSINCVPPPAGLVSWWRANGNGADFTGSNHATLNAVSFPTGKVDLAFGFNGSNSSVFVPAAASLNVGAGGGFTIEAWINPAELNVQRPIAEYTTGTNTYAVHFWANSQSAGAMYANIIGTDGIERILQTPSGVLTSNAFQHVALTYDKASGIARILRNGAVVQESAIGTFTPLTSGNFYIGYRAPTTPFGPIGFRGQIDELSLYNRALSVDQLQGIYNAGAAGKCTTPVPPSITTQPASQTVNVGSSVTFQVAAVGTPPLSYQWRFNGTNLAGATTTSVTLSNVQLVNGGLYSVIVSNPAGPGVLSSNALLTVVSPSNNCVPPPAGLVSWWRAEANALDANDGNNGTLFGNTAYTAGRVGQTFVFDGAGDGVSVGNPTNLQLQNFTIETWIRRASTARASFGFNGGQFFAYGAGGYGFGMLDNGTLYLTRVEVDNVMPNATIADTNYHHVAVTKVGTNVVFYIDGVAHFVPPYNTTYSFSSAAAVGARGDSLDNSFLGAIDELSVYNRALSAVEIQAIYNAGGGGKCSTGTAPSILTHPQGQTVSAGTNVNFSVVATGTQPLNYQWSLNGTNLAGATGSSLNLSNVQLAQSGNYSVRVTNLFGSVLSSNALLTVVPMTTNCIPPPIGLVSWWRAENNPLDQTDGNNGVLIANATYSAGRVGQAFLFDGAGDGVSLGNPTNLQLQNFTIEGWIRRASTARASFDFNGGQIFAYGGGGYGFGMLDNGRLYLTRVEVDNVMPNVTINDTNYHHVAVTKLETNVVFYIDGVAYLVPPYNTTYNFSTPAAVGARGDSLANSFLGSIDELSIYNRQLSGAEIQGIYTAGGGKCSTGVAPSIQTQPQSQTVEVGNSVNFSVAATGTSPLDYQWRFNGTNIAGATSTTLSLTNVQLSQAGNYSVRVTNLFGSALSSNATLTVNPAGPCASPPAGLVSWWRAESNPLDQVGGNNGSLVGNATYGPGRVGQAFVLDGSGDGVPVGNSTNLQLQNFTIEAWIKRASTARASFDFNGGELFAYGGGGYAFGMFDNGTLFLTRVEVDNVAANASINDTNYHHVAVTKLGTNVVFYIDGVAHVAPSYNTTYTFSSPAAVGVRGDTLANSFLGAIDELSVYNRQLSGGEIQAIYTASSAGKCLTAIPPTIAVQPTNRTISVGGTVTFNVGAAGTSPLSYQWSRNGTNIPGATTASLTLTNVQVSQAGIYAVVVTNLAGSVTSSNATLTVNFGPANVRVINSSGPGSSEITVPVVLVANGNENALGFSLNFSTVFLTYVGASLGEDASNATLLVNSSQVSTGRLGLALALPTGENFAPGTQQVVRVTFLAAAVANSALTTVSFGEAPIARQLSDTAGNPLQAVYTSGMVSITGVNLEADVTPRPQGDRNVTITDWVMVGRFAARLDFATNSGEFQRADCAPRSTLGNGTIGVTDWVQAGRYAARLDPLTAVGGPLEPSPARQSFGKTDASSRQLKVLNASLLQNHLGQVEVALEAQGDESALGFSLSFDPQALTYAGATLGSDANGATLNVNSTEAAAGRLGFVLALGTGNSFAQGNKQLVKVHLQPAIAGNHSVLLSDLPVPREVADAAALELPASYINGTVTVNPLPVLSITAAGDTIRLTWPQSADNYVLQQAEGSPAAAWTTLSPLVTVVNDENVVLLPQNSGARFYRLYRQP